MNDLPPRKDTVGSAGASGYYCPACHRVGVRYNPRCRFCGYESNLAPQSVPPQVAAGPFDKLPDLDSIDSGGAAATILKPLNLIP